MKKIIAALLLFAFISLSVVTAFGVSSPYWKGNPLIMKPGETKIVELNLQNMVGNEDVKLKATIIEGEDIATLTQDTFLVKAQTSDTKVPLKITIPKNMKNESREVKVEFKSVAPSKSKAVEMRAAMITNFDVIVVSEPLITEKKAITKTIIAIIGLIIILFVIYIIIRAKKRSKQ